MVFNGHDNIHQQTLTYLIHLSTSIWFSKLFCERYLWRKEWNLGTNTPKSASQCPFGDVVFAYILSWWGCCITYRYPLFLTRKSFTMFSAHQSHITGSSQSSRTPVRRLGIPTPLVLAGGDLPRRPNRLTKSSNTREQTHQDQSPPAVTLKDVSITSIFISAKSSISNSCYRAVFRYYETRKALPIERGPLRTTHRKTLVSPYIWIKRIPM